MVENGDVEIDIAAPHWASEGLKKAPITPEVPDQPSHDVEELALEVIEGKWGTLAGARRRLSKRGIDPDPVMAEVARLQ